MSITPPKPEDSQAWNLVALTPEYLEPEHGKYVQAIEIALNNNLIRNIALSGSYGIGKSSILREVSRRQENRVVELSLSTLAPVEALKLDESVPVQATTPTNRIQQEIVKQLLYREEPRKAPGSRFRRIERLQWPHELATAALLGFVVAVAFMVFGWSTEMATVLTPLISLGLWIHSVFWILATIVLLLFRYQIYGQFQIKQFSAGPATVMLDDRSVSYFDQYLDEIVYFFEVSKHDIVIFEDIDRFNDSYIFETLRSLNTLLNASPQIDKPIRFIYAIKDSIFDHIGLEDEGRKIESAVLDVDDPAQAESVRANRTKFFDLVIPVVPFITHRSARDLVVQLLDEINHKVDPELLDLAARYVPDMRLLKNVRNEFIVFRDRIFSGDGKQLSLSETDLFAMMLYKSTHLTDFEAIRVGHSKLDTLYLVSRDLVAENIRRIENDVHDSRYRLARINGATTRSDQLGKRLLALLRRTLQSAGLQHQNATYSFAGTEQSDDDLKSENFWSKFVSVDKDAAILVCNIPDYNYQRKRQFSFTRENLKADLNDPLDAESWNKVDRDTLSEQLDAQMEDLKFLRSADLGELINRPEFLVKRNEEEWTLDTVALDLLKSGLAYQLVRSGFINRNFTLYTATFHGNRVGSAAMNFIIHHVERDAMDEYFQLDPDDVDAVIREHNKNSLNEPVFYNIAILDRLLQTDVTAANIMIDSLSGFGESQKRFMQAYLNNGAERARLIERFTKVSPGVLVYLASQAELDDESRVDLVNVSLAHLADGIKYKTDSSVTSYLLNNYSVIATLSSEDIVPSQAERIASLFKESGAVLPLLKPLAKNVRRAFVSRNLYEIRQENLAVAIGSNSSLALDTIRYTDRTVYDYVLDDLEAFMAAIDGTSPTIEARRNFTSVIDDVLEHGPAQVNEAVRRASDECVVIDISEISDAVWPMLAKYERFPATFDNISRYLTKVGEIDVNVAKVLASAGAITAISAASDEAKTNVAVAILASRAVLPSAALRIQLVASLKLRDYLKVNSIAAEKGDLFALLIKHEIIADNGSVYEYLAGTDWPTREAVICESSAFKDYIEPTQVQGDLAALLLSKKISLDIKTAIVERAGEFAERAEVKGLSQLARFATEHGHQLSIEIIEKMALGGIPAQYLVVLLEPHLDSLGKEQLLPILRSLDGDYASLVSVGRDRPKIPNSVADRALLARLKQFGIVSTWNELGSQLIVNKKHK